MWGSQIIVVILRTITKKRSSTENKGDGKETSSLDKPNQKTRETTLSSEVTLKPKRKDEQSLGIPVVTFDDTGNYGV